MCLCQSDCERMEGKYKHPAITHFFHRRGFWNCLMGCRKVDDQSSRDAKSLLEITATCLISKANE